MSLVPAKCPECGGNINIDPNKRAGICEYCKQPFVVQEAIQNFNTTYNVTNNNEIHADIVNVYDNKETDFVIVAGVLKEYKGTSADIIIPDEVTSMKGAEGLENIRSITFGGGMSVINDDELPMRAHDYLKKIVFSDNVTKIGKDAFHDRRPHSFQVEVEEAGPETIVFSDSIIEIDDSAFEGCSNLKNLVLPQHLKRIGKNAFKGCRNIGTELIIPESVQLIDEGAFEGCKIKRVIIKNPNIQIASVGVFGYSDGFDYISISEIEFIGYDINGLVKKNRESIRSDYQKKYEEIRNIVRRCNQGGLCPACGKRLGMFGKCIYSSRHSHCENFEKKVFEKKTADVRDEIFIKITDERHRVFYVYKKGGAYYKWEGEYDAWGERSFKNDSIWIPKMLLEEFHNLL